MASHSPAGPSSRPNTAHLRKVPPRCLASDSAHTAVASQRAVNTPKLTSAITIQLLVYLPTSQIKDHVEVVDTAGREVSYVAKTKFAIEVLGTRVVAAHTPPKNKPLSAQPLDRRGNVWEHGTTQAEFLPGIGNTGGECATLVLDKGMSVLDVTLSITVPYADMYKKVGGDFSGLHDSEKRQELCVVKFVTQNTGVLGV